jgi:hypothetical protein
VNLFLLRVLTSAEMVLLYKFTKGSMFAIGLGLLGYGIWWLASPFILDIPGGSLWFFGIFPIYVGAMIILIAFAMKEDWFTNARKYW